MKGTFLVQARVPAVRKGEKTFQSQARVPAVRRQNHVYQRGLRVDVPQAPQPAFKIKKSLIEGKKIFNAGKVACGTGKMKSHLISGVHNRGYLPHLKQRGGTYFVTFRLDGSLPASIIRRCQAEIDIIIARAEKTDGILSDKDQKKLSDVYFDRIENHLDEGRGNCWLGRKDIAEWVVETMKLFEGERYILHAWVVMPNHVHIVITPIVEYALSSILHSVKSFTATKANEIVGRKGKPFWQKESFDRLIRDDAEFSRFRDYTIMNPVKAGLCKHPEEWEFSSAYNPKEA